MFNLPDLQGFFLRGVDPPRQPARPDAPVPSQVDPDRDQRVPPALNGNAGANVGSLQLYATALPRNRFRTSDAGEHKHSIDFETGASRDTGREYNTVAAPHIAGEVIPQTELAGVHAHEILDGDKETRPINAYVWWIIRYR
jgi:hypothetical protein